MSDTENVTRIDTAFDAGNPNTTDAVWHPRWIERVERMFPADQVCEKTGVDDGGVEQCPMQFDVLLEVGPGDLALG